MNHSLYVTAVLCNADDVAVLLMPFCCMLCSVSYTAMQWGWNL